MKLDVILELMDGRREEASLAKSFLPERNEIKVIVAGVGHVQTYPLAKICCVMMLPKSEIKIPDKKQIPEEITTVTGNRYVVHVLTNLKVQNGFYGLSREPGNPFKLIFFTHQGVGSASLGSVVWERFSKTAAW